MKEIRWGFIGCGEVTEKKSGPAFSEVAGSSVVAVMSRSEQKARRYAENHHIGKWYTDAQELIDDSDVNAVYIATPPSSHATFAIMAMKAGKPVYIEKPLAANYEDCARINKISADTGVPCFVAYYRRYLPYFQRVKEFIDRGIIGKIINVQIRFAVPAPDLDYHSHNLPWRLQPDIAGGGFFYDLAPHQLDLLQHIFGVITEADGICANRGGLYLAEDSVSACFRFENGLPGSGSWCFVAHDSARADRVEVIFPFSVTHPLNSTPKKVANASRYPIHPMSSFRSSRQSSSICRVSPSANVQASRPHLPTGRSTVFWERFSSHYLYIPL